jgi:PIN domain nuclease of toxin-antitoxin system
VKILLDTHALLWFVGGDARLSNRAREAIESPENEPWVSAASVWEIGIKLSLGKLHLSMSLNEFIRDHVTGNGMALLGITPDHVSRIVSMPFHHRDPFDRLLIAQAQEEGFEIIGGDPAFAAYGITLIW